jgi:hypothetical protein
VEQNLACGGARQAFVGDEYFTEFAMSDFSLSMVDQSKNREFLVKMFEVILCFIMLQVTAESNPKLRCCHESPNLEESLFSIFSVDFTLLY